MGNTVIEKIIRHNTGKDVKPGDIVNVTENSDKRKEIINP